MNDNEIISLYLERSEQAIRETDRKYGKYCRTVAQNILQNKEDSEECVSDTYLKVWQTVPPQIPRSLTAYLGCIVRHLALGLYEKRRTEKRGGGETAVALHDLAECLPAGKDTETAMEEKELSAHLDHFLTTLPAKTRTIFLRRYWYLSPIKEIAREIHMSEGSVRTTLCRTRAALKTYLEKEGLSI